MERLDQKITFEHIFEPDRKHLSNYYRDLSRALTVIKRDDLLPGVEKSLNYSELARENLIKSLEEIDAVFDSLSEEQFELLSTSG